MAPCNNNCLYYPEMQGQFGGRICKDRWYININTKSVLTFTPCNDAKNGVYISIAVCGACSSRTIHKKEGGYGQ